MTAPLDEAGLVRLREAADAPDLSQTRYRLVRRLARGGMGTVYVVEDEALGRQVALKVLSDPDPTGDLSARLVEEARHLARLEHPNIVPVHDVGRLPDDRVYYVMQLIRGQRADVWARASPGLPQLLRLFCRVCEAVAFAHAQGVIHRDLKPENVMVGAFGEAIVMDWGVATALGGAGRRAGPNLVVGTPAYMAPEQARGDAGAVDRRTDVYALGALLHALLTGGPPQESRASVAIPRPLASICRKAMAERQEDRYDDALSLAEDVLRHIDGLPVRAHPETLLDRAARLARRHWPLILLVLAYLAMRLAVLLVFTQ